MHPLSDAAPIFLISAAGCLLSGRLIIRWLTQVQGMAPVRYQDCPPLLAYQATKPATPTMGGVLVLGVGTLVAVTTGGLHEREGWLVLGTVMALAVVGLVDDVLKFRGKSAIGIRGLPKLLLTLAIGAVLGMASMPPQGSFGTGWIEIAGGWIVFAMAVIAGSAHAVNLTDGMDGLATGCVAIALSVLGLWAFSADGSHRVMGIWCASLAGACVGFLWFNSYPASVFLGDVGSMGLGAALGVMSLLTHTALWLLIIGGVFVVEALSVMVQVASYKWRGKRRVFRVAPLHHHFHLGGTSEPKLIVRFWIVGVLLAMLSLATVGLP